MCFSDGVHVTHLISALAILMIAVYVYENERKMSKMQEDLTDVKLSALQLTKSFEGLAEHIGDKNFLPIQEDPDNLLVSRPSDCSDLKGEDIYSGVYKIFPVKDLGFEVYCDMETDGGGWTVLQRRKNGKTNFYREWEHYKYGFGDLNEEFWLGNEHIHQLTSHGNYILRIDLEDFDNNKRFAEYMTFRIGDEKSGYKLSIGGYHGDAGDAMAYENGQKFSTIDKDNDLSTDNCAEQFSGAWWYKDCHHSNLNGLYLNGEHESMADGIEWKQWLGYNYSLKKTTMMIRKA